MPLYRAELGNGESLDYGTIIVNARSKREVPKILQGMQSHPERYGLASEVEPDCPEFLTIRSFRLPEDIQSVQRIDLRRRLIYAGFESGED